MDTQYSEAGARCGACGAQSYVVFRSCRPTRGMAVAKEVTRYSCKACGAPLMEEDVGDNEHVILVAAEDPHAEEIRQSNRAARALSRRLRTAPSVYPTPSSTKFRYDRNMVVFD